MTATSMGILCVQETHTSHNSKEKRKDYTWYLNGSNEGEREFAGMAIIIRNKMAKYLKDVIPHSNRMVEVRLEGTAPITILAIYAPQSGRATEEK